MIDLEREQTAAELKGSLLEFTRFFYKHLTGRDFIVSNPPGRESHHIAVCKAFTNLFYNQRDTHGLIMNLPPGYGKSVLTSMFVAWSFAHYADCNFLYISYSHDLAASHTAFIKQIMTSAMYKYLFDVKISTETRAKDHFMTSAGGCVAAFGSSGAVTGRNAGAPGQKRFSGCVIIDDAHKPNEVHSDSTRENVIRNYCETIAQRPRDDNVPIVFIGQRLHEDDLAAYLMSGKDVRQWDKVILKGIDEAGNALYPEVQSLAYLKELKEKQPFVFSSQIQQEPIPSGGSVFKPEWFIRLTEEPEILFTFICVDSAETSKNYNDATAMGFFGIYEIEVMGQKTGDYGLHVLDIREIRVEPKDLHDEFIYFYQDCLLHAVKPRVAAIEKKSTGVTLISTLSDIRGIEIRNIDRNSNSGSKTTRFLACQPLCASKLISFPSHARHTEHTIKHMAKITANESHAHDDIADIICDAIDLALIRKSLIYNTKQSTHVAATILSNQKKSLRARSNLYGGNQGGF